MEMKPLPQKFSLFLVTTKMLQVTSYELLTLAQARIQILVIN